jgi:hypothetical protein
MSVKSRRDGTQEFVEVNERFLLDGNQANIVISETGYVGPVVRPGVEYQYSDLEVRREYIAYNAAGVEIPLGDLWHRRETLRNQTAQNRVAGYVTSVVWDAPSGTYVYKHTPEPKPDTSNPAGWGNKPDGMTLTSKDLEAIKGVVAAALRDTEGIDVEVAQ